MGGDEPIAGVEATVDLVVADQSLNVFARLSRLLIGGPWRGHRNAVSSVSFAFGRAE
jgi:hypothetical protein